MTIDSLLDPRGGGSALLLGNEAIARGALEARVGFVSGYPGTPASEIGDVFERVGGRTGVKFEWSVNEKVALEIAFGASLAGTRSLVFMKHLGLVYAGDPLSTIPYIGVVGGMVIVSAADPSCHTSPNEQDQRHIGRMLGIPTLDPSSPEEARAMTRFAYELSEQCELPVLLRTTARVAHTRAAVELRKFEDARPAPRFVPDPDRFVPVPNNARRLRLKLQDRLATAQRIMAAAGFCPQREGRGRKGVLTVGAPHFLVAETLEALGRADDVRLLRLGTMHPLPDDIILSFLFGLDEVLVVEELSPYVEDSILAMAHHYGLPVRVEGKRTGAMRWPYELGPDVVEPALRKFLGLPAAEPAAAVAELPGRPPSLCPGCPHLGSFTAARMVFGDDAVYVNDIGCYTLGFQPPHRAGDVLLSMGASIPIAAGIARTTGRRTVAFIGDSTFFHSGLPGLANAVEHQDDVVLIVMDNHATAMTGHQPSPTSPVDRAGRPRGHRDIEACVRALGVADVQRVDPHDLATTSAALRRARDAKGPSVVIAERPCPYYLAGPARPASDALPEVDPARCHTCGLREAGLGCGLGESAALDRLALERRAEDGALLRRAFGVALPQVAPCATGCPIGICPQAYIGSLAAGEPEDALRAVVERAALPSVCSHICHRPCEDRCVRAASDEAIAINELKRHLTEAAGLAVHHPAGEPVGPDARRVAVVGAGPAGLAAARDLRRRGHRVTLLDAADQPGGALALIPEHRLPRAVLRRDLDALVALPGIDFRGGVRLGRDVTVAELRAQGHAAILLALGAARARVPAIPGADGPLVVDALAFLRERPEPLSGRVVVVGGGDVAIDAARTAVRRGAKVTLLALEARDALPADPATVAAAEAEGVDVRAGVGVAAIERDGQVRTAAVARIAVAPGGELRPELGAPAGDVAAARVVLATGLAADLDGLELGGVAVRPGGWLDGDAWGRTAVADLFVAGDVTLGAANVTRAMASGVRAAWAIDVALRGAAVAPACRAPLDVAERAPAHGRRRRAADGGAPLDRAAAVAEASRCLFCAQCSRCDACMRAVGCPAFVRGERANEIDPTLCIACGLCVAACPNGAVSTGARA